MVPGETPGPPGGAARVPRKVDPEQLMHHHFLKLWPEEECDARALDQRRRTSNHGQGLVAFACSPSPWEVRVPCSPGFCMQGLFCLLFLIPLIEA